MPGKNHSYKVQEFTNLLNASLFVGLTFGVACVQEATKDEICDGNGEMHGTHCHCDDGFALSDDGLSCEVDQNADNQNNGDGITFEPQQIQAATGTENNSNIWLLEAIDDDLKLNIEIYESFGGISSPGSITIDDNEANYATCGTCVLLQTGCVLHGDHYDCSRTFMPKVGGEVHIDQIGPSAGDDFSGELIGIEFQEVSIGQDYQTEPVADGQTITLNAWSFETQLESR